MAEITSFETTTRAVFNNHHRAQSNNEYIFNRLTSLISEEYFGFEKNYFKDKVILDAGCGSNANASFAFLSLGAEKVISLDLGTEWQSCARERLKVFGSRSEFVDGSVLDLPFAEQTFDFVHCAGVLHHTSDPYKGFQNLAKVVSKDGWVFITIMANAKGIIYQCINHLRDLYMKDLDFRAIIDSLNNEKLQEGLNWLLNEKNKNEKEFIYGENDFFRSLFDLDLILTIKDRIQAPTYHNFDFTEEQLNDWYASNNFKNIKRLTRYTKDFRNLRRFLAPMYYSYDHPISKFWFGEGYIQLIGQKNS